MPRTCAHRSPRAIETSARSQHCLVRRIDTEAAWFPRPALHGPSNDCGGECRRKRGAPGSGQRQPVPEHPTRTSAPPGRLPSHACAARSGRPQEPRRPRADPAVSVRGERRGRDSLSRRDWRFRQLLQGIDPTESMSNRRCGCLECIAQPAGTGFRAIHLGLTVYL